MQEPFDTIFKLLLGACFGGFITHNLAKGRERKRDADNRRRTFRDAMSGLRDNLKAVKDERLVEAHSQWVSIVRTECAKVREDLSHSKLIEFDQNTTAFTNLSKEDIENRDKNEKRPPTLDQFGQYQPRPNWQPSPNYGPSRERMVKILNDLIVSAE